jgi:hypothetical protein
MHQKIQKCQNGNIKNKQKLVHLARYVRILDSFNEVNLNI